MINGYRKVFVESNRYGYSFDEIINGEPIFSEYDKDFFKNKNLILPSGNNFKVSFVGEIITPNGKYFSLPKNFRLETETQIIENIDLFKKVLNRFGGDFKIPSFSITPEGVISEKFFYDELKHYFLDYITYEFIYPKKPVLKHSTSPMKGGKVDVFQTIKNRKQRGTGMSYKIKDIINKDDWKIDDIYWSVIDLLASKYNDRTEIDEMKSFLDSEGYIIKRIPNEELSNSELMIEEINKCDVGIIHSQIKKILLSYFESKTVSESYEVDAFYVEKFAYVWEELVRSALKHNNEFKSFCNTEYQFQRERTHTKRFFTEKEMNDFIETTKKKIKIVEKSKIGRETWRLRFTMDVKSIPDLFSEYQGKKFIGDAKYYEDPENAHFEKEFITYNTIIDNEYPMVVFIPAINNRVVDVWHEEEFELFIIRLSVKDCLENAVSGSDDLINKVHKFISKDTERQF
jgi:hypothetical protein